jgi:hypothetical protein
METPIEFRTGARTDTLIAPLEFSHLWVKRWVWNDSFIDSVAWLGYCCR